MPAAILIVVAGLLTLSGVASLTQATQGVGLIALACFFGIIARIAQASSHQRATETEEQRSARLAKSAKAATASDGWTNG